jgi:hypothetical protein
VVEVVLVNIMQEVVVVLAELVEKVRSIMPQLAVRDFVATF